MTVYQVIVDGKLREIHRASGDALGGTMVDKTFEKLLTDIIGKHVCFLPSIHQSIAISMERDNITFPSVNNVYIVYINIMPEHIHLFCYRVDF